MRERLGKILRTGCVIAGLIAISGPIAIGQDQAGSAHTFGVQGDQFALDGKPFQIISGEMHYPRIPRVLAAAAEDGEGDGIEYHHNLRLLERA